MPTRTTIFPPDGNWTGIRGFLDTAHTLASPETAMFAMHMLQPIFTTDWASEMHVRELAEPHTLPHPFMASFHHPGGIRDLVELGLALLVTGSPPELTRDLTTPARYRSRCREIITAAYFRCLRAEITVVPEGPGDKRPEFIARLDGSEAAVEVKGLDYGEQERLHHAAAFQILRCLQEGASSLPSVRGSYLDVRLGARVLGMLIRGTRVDLEDAERLGNEICRAWARLAEEGASPGDRPGPRGTTLEFQLRSSDDGHQSALLDLLPATPNYVRRIRQRLKGAAQKFRDARLPGIVVLEPPVMLIRWRDEIVDKLALDLRGNQAWVDDIAAVVLTETHSFAEPRQPLELGSDLRILRGKRWTELPRPLQDRWGTCTRCGYRHDHFDLVSLAKAAAGSSRPPVASKQTGP